MGSGSMLLDPISTETFGNEFRRREQQLFDHERARRKAKLGRDPEAGEYERTPDQRRADAPNPLSRLIELASGRVISVSRRRNFAGALRELVKVRCDIPANRCQIDHIEPWAAGGMTAQDNGRPACGRHNRLRHQRQPPTTPDEG